MENYLWLIPFLPACGAVILLIIGRFLPKMLVSIIACGTIFTSFILAVITFIQLLGLPADERIIHQTAYTWLQAGAFKASVAFLVDPLSIIMLLVVTGVGFLIHVYSIGYMADDKRYSRYFGFLNLFVFAMLLLVSGDNLLMMFIGWEGVGLCSYLLIGFWFEKTANAIAGMKAFIVNRIGDFGFVLGVMLLFWSLGQVSGQWTVTFTELREHAHYLTPAIATAVGILLFIGACGKSAQIPLYIWLPDAMAGPTPVSALIHAATMVTAGVYMIARMNFVYVLSPTAMMVVAIVGVGTALFAGTIGLFQKDIKKVLAYSTISQLGYMFLGVGVGAFAAGIFHLMTHAFFKALLFMGSGSVIHGTGGEQDIEKMGGLRKYMPVTFWTFLVGTLAIAGIPGLSGFFSKDEILWKAFSSSHGHWALWLVGLIAAGCTSFYMFRLLFKTFFGKNYSELVHHTPEQESSGTPVCCDDKDSAHNSHGHNSHGAHKGPAHESPWIMTVPLIILAVLSIIGGYVGIPAIIGGANHIEHFMEPVFSASAESAPHESSTPEHHSPVEFILMVVSVLVALAGISAAYYLYMVKPHIPKQLAAKFAFIYKLVFNKYYVDEIYQKVFVNNLLRLNNLLAYPIDLGIIDRIVNAAGLGTVGVSNGSGWTDAKFVDGAVNGTATTVLTGGKAARVPQTGKLKHYLTWAVAGVVVVIAGFWWLLR
ncbi:MAG: NADH-quinone oxidoreductase subunit L [Planctomycetes bacterium]|nr:NADH-quinone oxidoreductase subunit L [Planctomycetota bacterium]